MKDRTFRAGDTVTTEGQGGIGFFVIENGEAKVSIGGEERRLSREDLLRVAAAVGGAGLLAGRAGIADAARTQLLKESGRLKVLDWAGYENDGGQPMFAAYVKAHPKNKPQFSYMTNEADA